MAQNITLMGADYPDVPAVDLPKTGGGTARFVDALGVVTSVNGETGDVTITASDLNALKGNAGGLFYGTCSTVAGTAAKVVECADFTADNLKAGTIIVVSFSATNSGAVASLTLNVNSTGAKPIKYINNGTLGNLSSAGYLKANVEYPFYYDGTNWVVWFNYNTTYSALSEADMHTGTATTARTITAQRLKQAVEYHAPVKSVNGQTGAVTVVEGLEPLIGTTATVTPQQVMTALGEGRDICIEATGALGILPLALKFTDFNRATDTAYSGAVADIVASQTIINSGGTWYVYTLFGGSMQGQSIPWTVNDTQMVPSSRTINGYTLDQNITISLSDLNGVPTSRRINNKSLANDIILLAADVYATPNLASGSQNTVCFGDSLFGMYRGDDSAPAYAQQIAGGIVRNVGFGGCRMSVHPTHGYAEFSMWALAKAVAENDFTAQDQYASSGQDYFADQLALLKNVTWASVEAVVIHYGTNDFQGGVPLDDATHSNDYNTICGALRYSIEKLLTAYPHLKIFVSLPVFRYWTEGGVTTYSDTKKNSNDITLPEVCKALNNVAYEYGLPVIDGYNGLGVNKVNATYYYTDGTHHNDNGRKRFGNFIGRNLISPQPAHYIGSQEEGPSYTNMLDEVGWTDGVRLSSSGADSADAGFVTSGYIPCQYLDYIYLKNISYNSASSSASSQRICFYDSSKTFITGCISGANATAQLGKEYDSNNDLVKFQIANVGSYSAANAAYFRICAPHIGSDSIITVNEPIE